MMPMNDAARKTWEMMESGTGFPLAPENMETTKAAFPLAVDEFVNITSTEVGIVSFGLVGSRVLCQWCYVDGTSGYRFLDNPHPSLIKKPSLVSRFFRWLARS